MAPLVAAVEANDANIDIGAAVVNPPTNEREARDGDFNLQDERRQRIYRLRVVIVVRSFLFILPTELLTDAYLGLFACCEASSRYSTP